MQQNTASELYNITGVFRRLISIAPTAPGVIASSDLTKKPGVRLLSDPYIITGVMSKTGLIISTEVRTIPDLCNNTGVPKALALIFIKTILLIKKHLLK
jgi:hypothetical protein